jgi:hypothetical protein
MLRIPEADSPLPLQGHPNTELNPYSSKGERIGNALRLISLVQNHQAMIVFAGPPLFRMVNERK